MNENLSKLRWTVGGLLLSGALGLGLWGLTTAQVQAGRSDGYEAEDAEAGRPGRNVAGAVDPRYAEECGACHLAYPAKLLPGDHWRAIMSQLDDHFGENAELGAQAQAQITAYLVRHAADNGDYQGRRYLARGSSASLRISEQPFFRREHDEIPVRLVKGNEQVGSFSRCDACHQDAAKGNFDEERIQIPGRGRWDD